MLSLLTYLCSYTEVSRLSTSCQVVVKTWSWHVLAVVTMKYIVEDSLLFNTPALAKHFPINNLNVANFPGNLCPKNSTTLGFHGSSYRFRLISSMMKPHVVTYKLLLDCSSQWHEYRHASCLCQVCKFSVTAVRIWTHQLCIMWHTPLTSMEKQCVSVRGSAVPARDVLTERESVRVWEWVGSCSGLI